jgi:hypothetical protein
VQGVSDLANTACDAVAFHERNQSKREHVLDEWSHGVTESRDAEYVQTSGDLADHPQVLQVIMLAIIAGLQQVGHVSGRDNGKQGQNGGNEVVNAVPLLFLCFSAGFAVPFNELGYHKWNIQSHANLSNENHQL